MLNKLLKRCMPWMDKGRWYKISIIGDSLDTAHIDHDPIFSQIDRNGTTFYAILAENRKIYQIIDIKFVPQNGRTFNGTQVIVNGFGDGEIEIGNLELPGTIWLFMKVG